VCVCVCVCLCVCDKHWITKHTFLVFQMGIASKGLTTTILLLASVKYSTHKGAHSHIHRVGQNRIYTPYMTVCMVISMPKIPYVHRIYL